MFNRVFLAGPALLALAAQPALAQQPCDALARVKLPYATITSATMVAEGPFSAPARRGAPERGPAAPAPALMVPAHCEVNGVIKPSPDSDIKFAMWLPTATAWNGKYRQQGNGGWAGSIGYQAMVDPLTRGYVTAATDDGHEGDALTGAGWAIGHPEKLIDFGHRAVHETSVQAKAILRAFYGKDPSLSYFFGCSDGGREALMEAQRYPEDFNGIIAGAPANNWSHLFTGFVWNEQALTRTADSGIGPAKLPAITKAVLAACDKLDGVKDGLIDDPRVCKFDPAVLACKGVDKADCLTPPQVAALKQLYAGPKNPRTGEQIYPGMPPGAETAGGGGGGWNTWITTADPTKSIQSGFGNSYYGQAVFEDPKWDFKALNFDADVRFGDAKAGMHLNSNSPDLRSFRARGGKLIQYHGWGDAAISATNSIEYYETARAFMTKFPDGRSDGSKPIEDFYRLFMVAGMGHCSGGYGPNRFGNETPVAASTRSDPERDVFAALERWVEKGVAPDHLIGQGTATDDPAKVLTRPLCQYPKVAQYKGSGDINDAASFTCAAAARR